MTHKKNDAQIEQVTGDFVTEVIHTFECDTATWEIVRIGYTDTSVLDTYVYRRDGKVLTYPTSEFAIESTAPVGATKALHHFYPEYSEEIEGLFFTAVCASL